MSVTPLFIFSMPRAGSTLLQRMLTTRPQIASTAEPWVLLPQMYALRRNGVVAEYVHSPTYAAIQDFCGAMPDGLADYHRALRRFVLELYDRASPDGTRYFLDKTPRYSLVADQIVEVLPEAKFVFLWRHPLATAASMTETWGALRFHPLCVLRNDLRRGVDNLVRTSRALGERACCVRYEDLLTEPEATMRRLADYLDIDFAPEMIEGFSKVELTGAMGDPTGRKAYQQLSRAPLDKWRKTMANPVRRRWCLRYLDWLGAERLGHMGYDLDALRAEAATMPLSGRGLARDLVTMTTGSVREKARDILFGFAGDRR